MSRRCSHTIIQVMLMAAAIAIVGTGCGESTSPENGNPYQDVPSIPKPAAPGAETGAYSDTLTVISPLATNYRPEVTDIYMTWTKQYRCAYTNRCTFGADETPSNSPYIWSFGDWVAASPEAAWSSQELLPVAMCCDGIVPPPGPVSVEGYFPPGRHLLYEDGEIAQNLSGELGPVDAWVSECYPEITFGQAWATQYKVSYEGFQLSSAPQLRRDRFWVRRPLEGGIGNYLLLIGNVQGEIATTYTSGSSTTETEEFGRTVSASAGLDFGKLSLGVQASISRTFSTSVTVSQESSESFTKTVFGEDGKIVQFQVWELVERYTITDSAGEPFTDPAFVFEPVEFHIHGAALALDATKFDQ